MKNKVLLVGINAKYIHSNLAIRYLRSFALSKGHIYYISEYTINQRKDYILSSIYRQKPDILGFSCYIWNISLIKELICDIRKILPNTVIVLGGPEISDDDREFGEVIQGAGEQAFYELVCRAEAVSDFAGRGSFSFQKTVFPYTDGDFKELRGRIIYYEAQRGCPFKCSYCLSANAPGVERLSIERVYRELCVFLNNKVKQVKFVDRTFNCNEAFRRDIWSYLIENDNGVTNFHFEITGELLSDTDFLILSRARAGLFQFEIGVQTTNPKTVLEINRATDLSILFENVRRLKKINIHLHLDLIAGLPYEGYSQFKKSFNDVYELSPDMLQLGFLKALKGSIMRKNAEKYGLVYSDYAPYEVLCTDSVSHDEILMLKGIEHMLEAYYNSGLVPVLLKFVMQFINPFDFFQRLYEFWRENGYDGALHSKMEMYTIIMYFLRKFFPEYADAFGGDELINKAEDALVFDILINDNIKTMPKGVERELDKRHRAVVSNIYGDREVIGGIDGRLLAFDKKRLWRATNVAFFDYVVNGDFEKRETVIFFHYLAENGRGTAYELKI